MRAFRLLLAVLLFAQIVFGAYLLHRGVISPPVMLFFCGLTLLLAAAAAKGLD